MSNQPTVADLAHRAMQLNDLLNNAMARLFIRTNNIRSVSKLETLVKEQLEGKTAEEVKTMLPVTEEDEAKALEAANAAKSKPASKPASKTPASGKEPATGKKTFERKGREKKATTIVNEGPRGFRFGPTWCNSVLSQEGIAVLPAHKNKLLKHAESLGISKFTADDDSVKIAKAIAPKLEKFLEDQEAAAKA